MMDAFRPFRALLAGLSLAALAALPAIAAPQARAQPAAQTQTAHRRSPYIGAIAVDAATGRVLYSDMAGRECYPASCTKLMTARLLLKAVKEGKLSMSDRLVQSKRSEREQPSHSGLRAGEEVSVDDAMKYLMLKSANDVAVMVAERLGGSVEGFVAMMNDEARALGMANTTYASPNGLPPPRGSSRGFDRSTAADLAKLARAILSEQPEILGWTRLAKARVPTHAGAIIEIPNHNNFLNNDYRGWRRGVKMPEADGLKTGYIDAGGSSIVLTGQRAGKRAIVVVVGSASAPEREEAAGRMLSDALGALVW